MAASLGGGIGGVPRRVHPDDIAQLSLAPVGGRRVLGLFSPHAGQLFLLTIVIVIASLTSLAQPFLLREVIDVALPNQDRTLLVWMVSGMVGVAAIGAVLAVIQTWMATTMGQKVMHDLRVSAFNHVQAQSISFFKRTRGGEIQARLLQDIAGVQGMITTVATAVASNFTAAIGTAAAMVALDWRLSLVSLLVLPPSIWITRRVGLARRELKSERQKLMADLHSQVDEALSVNGAMLTKTLGAAKARSREFARASTSLGDLDTRSQLAGRWRMGTMEFVFAAIPATLYLTAGMPIGNQISIGTLVAFTSLQTQIFRPITGLLNVGTQWISSMALLSRIFGYLDLPVEVPEPEHPTHLPPSTARGEVRFRKVSYRYWDGNRDVLTDIDFAIPPGGSLAVVGETGSGKSTLATLMVRLADPNRGSVTIDGVDLRKLTPENLAAVVGVVTQETYLAHMSVRDNLLIARPGATDEEIWAALEAAQVAHVVRTLPDQLSTIVGARGHRFSGGERQRIAIARTILANPRVLVLDEATSSLDTSTEREVSEAIDRLAHGRTTLTIAHRLSTIQYADQILVISGGSIVERGTYSELVAAGGQFARLAEAVPPPTAVAET